MDKSDQYIKMCEKLPDEFWKGIDTKDGDFIAERHHGKIEINSIGDYCIERGELGYTDG